MPAIPSEVDSEWDGSNLHSTPMCCSGTNRRNMPVPSEDSGRLPEVQEGGAVLRRGRGRTAKKVVRWTCMGCGFVAEAASQSDPWAVYGRDHRNSRRSQSGPVQAFSRIGGIGARSFSIWQQRYAGDVEQNGRADYLGTAEWFFSPPSLFVAPDRSLSLRILNTSRIDLHTTAQRRTDDPYASSENRANT
jgi:hypothetical protein